jgi:hypothetical protein
MGSVGVFIMFAVIELADVRVISVVDGFVFP